MNYTSTYLAWRGLSGLSRAALILAALAVVVLLWIMPSLLSALFAGSLAIEKEPRAEDNPDVLAYEENVKGYREFASLRSPFFEPVAPSKPAPPPIRVVESGAAPPPRAYGGPKLVGFAGNQAMFASPVYNNEPFIRVGEKGVVELVSIEQPWRAKVRWSGAEFDLNLFDRLELNPIVNFGESGAGRPGAGADIFGTGTAPAATLQFDATAAGDAMESDDN